MEFKKKIINNKIIIQNFSYLSLFQIFTLLAPLITYPYIIRVVGLELYGVVVFAQTIVTYFSLVINFGFNFSGPRDVALCKNDHNLLSEYVSSIYIIKSGLWFICLISYLVLIYSFNFFHAHLIVYIISYFITLSDVLFPIWFFQGTEKMKYITYINLFVRTLFIIAIFIFIKQSSDFILIPVFNSVGALVSGLIALFIVFRNEGVIFTRVSNNTLVSRLKDGFTLFISTISIQIYLNLNKIIVGRFLGMKEVTIYDMAEKVTLLLKIPIGLISQATFPKISRDKSISFINKIMFLVLSVVTVIYFILFFTSNWIVLLLMHMTIPVAVNTVRILGLSVIFISLNIFLGSNRLVPFGYNKQFMFVTVTNSIVYLITIGTFLVFNLISIYTVAFTFVFIEAFCFVQLLFMNKKLKLLWSK